MAKKKLLISFLVTAAAATLVGLGTFAYFSDTETSTGNTFDAGTLNLTMDGNDGTNTVEFTVAGSVPGDSGAGTWTLHNAGNVAGFLDLESITVSNVENYDATTDAAEAADDADTSDATGGGELGAHLDVQLFWDDGSGGGTMNNATQDGTEATIYSGALDSILGTYDQSMPLAAGTSTYLSMTWSIGTTVDNTIMGDGVTFGMNVDLDQTAGQ